MPLCCCERCPGGVGVVVEWELLGEAAEAMIEMKLETLVVYRD